MTWPFIAQETDTQELKYHVHSHLARGNLDTETHRKENNVKKHGENGQGERPGIDLLSKEGSSIADTLTSNVCLQNNQTIIFCCLSFPSCGTLLHSPGKSGQAQSGAS
jgi:hypothetical protein